MLSALLLILLCRGVALAEGKAVLSFHSFDGGGPEFRIVLEDPSLVSVDSEHRYNKPDHALLDGAAYDVIYTFTGLKPGETSMTILVRSPIGDNYDLEYTVSVDEALDVTLTEKRAFTRFSLTRDGGAPCYELEMLEDEFYLRVNQGAWLRIDAGVAEALREIVDECGIGAWNSFEAEPSDEPQGERFRLEINYVDGGMLRVGGDIGLPECAEAFARVDELLEEFVCPGKEAIPGAYRYGGEGFGGDFTIALAPDGTYTFYEGMLSSYMGGGEWIFDGALLYLLEENGMELFNLFIPVRGALVFLGDESTNFPYVTVPDGGRFEKVSDSWESDEARGALADSMPTLAIEVNGTVFYAVPEKNASADALIGKLNSGGITVEMSDYGGFEKVGPLPWRLPETNEDVTTAPGDVILYQGDRITVYYGENSWNLTRLARIGNVTRERLLSAFGEGDATVRFWLEWSE